MKPEKRMIRVFEFTKLFALSEPLPGVGCFILGFTGDIVVLLLICMLEPFADDLSLFILFLLRLLHFPFFLF